MGKMMILQSKCMQISIHSYSGAAAYEQESQWFLLKTTPKWRLGLGLNDALTKRCVVECPMRTRAPGI